MYRDDDSTGPDWPDMDAVMADVEIHERVVAATPQERRVPTVLKGHELAGEWAALDELLEESGGEITPEIEALMENLDASTTEKIERIALVVLRKQSEARAIKEQDTRLAARAKTRENEAARLQEYLARVMRSIGKDRIEGTLATVAFQKNPPSVVVNDDVLDDDALQRMSNDERLGKLVAWTPEKYALDRRAVLDAAKSGDVLPEGVTVVQTTSLRIR